MPFTETLADLQPTTSTAEDRKARAKLAAALILQGSSVEPVRHWTQGAARVAQALSGGLQLGQVGRDADIEEANTAATLANLPGFGGPPAPAGNMPTMAPRPTTAAALSGEPSEPPAGPSPYKLANLAPRDSQDTFRTPLDVMAPRAQGIDALKTAMAGPAPAQPSMSGMTPPGAVPVQTQAITPPAPTAVAQATPTITGNQMDPGTRQYIKSLLANPGTRKYGETLYNHFMTKSKDVWTQKIDPASGVPFQENMNTGERKADPTRETAITEIEYARNNWQKLGLPDPSSNDPQARDFWQSQISKRLGGPGANISFSTEKKGQEELASKSITGYTEAQFTSREAQKRIGIYDRMEKAAESFKPGASAEIRLAGQRWLKELGVSAGDNVPEGEVLKMLGQQLAIHAQPKGQGAVSNFEREMFAKSLPNMTQSPEGFRKAVDISRSLEKFDFKVAQIYRDSARNNKGLPNYLEVQDKIAELGSPLSDDQMATISGTGSGASPPPDQGGWITVPNGARIRQR